MFTILGIVLGASIPTAAKYLEHKSTYKKEEKVKYEMITRKLLTEFLPMIDSCLFRVGVYINRKEDGVVTRDMPGAVSKKFDELERYYEKEIKNYYPLEMHAKISEVVSEISRLSFDIMFDNPDNSTNADISRSVEKCESLAKDISKHIEKKYI